MSSLSSPVVSSRTRWAPLLPSSLSMLGTPLTGGQRGPLMWPAPHAVMADVRALYTVPQFAQCEPAFTESALRNLIFKAQPRYSSKGVLPGNGLLEAGAIVRIQRKVLIHRERFLAWVQR